MEGIIRNGFAFKNQNYIFERIIFKYKETNGFLKDTNLFYLCKELNYLNDYSTDIYF